jgi:hypothetical protein
LPGRLATARPASDFLDESIDVVIELLKAVLDCRAWVVGAEY